MLFEISVVAVLTSVALAIYLHGKSDRDEPQRYARVLGDEDLKSILVTYSKVIPGHEIQKVVGYIESSSVLPKEGNYSLKLAEDATVHKLMQKAKNLGANAIVELKIEKEDFPVHIRITARGLAVRI